MAYYKPQSPIKKGEDYIYPLTTVDQIVLDDGTRLSERYVTANLTDMEAGMAPFTDADTLGGVLASEYALKADVADNYVSKSGDTMSGNLIVPSLYIDNIEIRDLFFPVGSIYVTSTNINPSDRLGGEWTLRNKHFSSNRFNSTNFMTYDESIVTPVDSYAQRNGDSLTINFNFKPVAAWSDEAWTIGTLNLNVLGVSALPHAAYFVAMGDGAGGLAELKLDANGILTCSDTIAVNGGDALTANYALSGLVTFTIGQQYKLDEACNEFIWLRTA